MKITHTKSVANTTAIAGILAALVFLFGLWLMCDLTRHAIDKGQRPRFGVVVEKFHAEFTTQEAGSK